jgi:glycosyltransferase involved in cell wall biosynthesis
MELVHVRTVDSKHLESIVASATSTLGTIGRDFDVVHFHAVGPGLFAPFVRLLTRARVVQTIHGLDGERAKWGRLASVLLRFGTWLSAKVPHATIVVSKALQEAYRERYSSETVYIANGTPEAEPREASAITERWGLTKGSYVLAVGRLVPEKAPEQLLAAFADVPGDVRLVLAGGSSHTDEYVADLEARAAADPRVIMAGYVYGTVLEELYANAAVFVLPSLLEGLPLTLLEAASYGCSIVASDIPPHLEVIGASGPGARVFPAGDVHQLTKAITEALQAPPDEDRAGAVALSERVRRTYSWDTAAADTDAVYRQVPGRRSVLSPGRQRAAR